LLLRAKTKHKRGTAVSVANQRHDIDDDSLPPKITLRSTVRKAFGKRGADVRPDFNWNKQPVAMMGYRSSVCGNSPR
jgi:hypothetical protein